MPRPVISGPLSVAHTQMGAYDNQALYDSRYGQSTASASADRRSRRAQRSHHDSYHVYDRPQQSTSSRYNSETERKPVPARKRARFAEDSEVSQDWVCTRTPISPTPPAHSPKTRPLPTPLQTPYTSSSRTMVSQQSSARTLVDHPVRAPEAPFSPTHKSPIFSGESSPFAQNKPLPTPPNPQTFSLAMESLYEEHSKPTLTSTPGSNELMPQREQHIIRTQAQSYSLGGSLKAIWKKTTAQIRVVRQAGLAAIMSPAVVDRDSVLWSGFSKVPVPPTEASEGSSIRTRSSNSSVRSSGWWRSREIAIVESSERLEMMSTNSAESGSYRTARTRRSSESQSGHMFA